MVRGIGEAVLVQPLYKPKSLDYKILWVNQSLCYVQIKEKFVWE